MIAVGLVTPKWLSSLAEADIIRQAKGGKSASDTVLVVCQLSGGNDGLNTVIPYSDSQYYSLRPTLGIREAQAIKLNDHIALHPSMQPLADLYKKGKVAIIQNVGYPQPNRSHFRSMEIWQSASPDNKLKYGWVGRHFDQQATIGQLNPVVALGLSTEKPKSLDAKTASIPCFASLADMQSMVGDPDMEAMLRRIQGSDSANAGTRVVQQANKTAFDAMSILSKKLGTYTPSGAYGNDSFGQGFKQIAQLLATSPQTRLVYFSASGFDTHARQADSHSKLLGGFSNAIAAFQGEMEAIGKADKIVVLVFSEFGRRTFENTSGGTDHGAAAPMFLIGNRVKGGLHGPNPNLTDLSDGDLKFTTDFREVYATAVDDWLGGDSTVVLGTKFKSVEVIT